MQEILFFNFLLTLKGLYEWCIIHQHARRIVQLQPAKPMLTQGNEYTNLIKISKH